MYGAAITRTSRARALGTRLLLRQGRVRITLLTQRKRPPARLLHGRRRQHQRIRLAAAAVSISPNQPGRSARTHLPLELFERLQRQGGGRRGASLLQREAREF